MPEKTCTVLFTPSQTEIEVPAGTTILAAAQDGGVFINSLCAGDGVCGRCRVIVRQGRVTPGASDSFTPDEVSQGYVLACEAGIESDVVVDVLEEHSLDGADDAAPSEVPYLADLSKLIKYVRLRPLVRRTPLQLPPPTLDNPICDLDRITHALGPAVPADSYEMDLQVMQRLPEVVRQSNWNVTALTGRRGGSVREILGVEGGDAERPNMCVAVDVGTTTITCHLVDLADGRTLGQAGKYSSQIQYGADVIRRIIYSQQSEANRRTLRQTVVDDINELIAELIARYSIDSRDIAMMTAAGNTTMMHLLLGLPVENVRREPYVGAAYALPPFRASEVGLRIHPRGLLYCLPSVAAYVGSDIVAGIFATALTKSDDVRMLIDVGTNGEVVVGNKDFVICASASAGPAFEGSECTGGMRAAPGAVDHIRLLDANRVLSYSTIASAPAAGLCGTGYVDIVAEMLRVGVIDKTGRIQPDSSPARVREGDGGEMEYVILPAELATTGKDIVITQGDVSNILRAKGAIYAAESVLLNALDMTFDNVKEIMVAGGFGNFLDVENAVRIGLLPDVGADGLRFVGNTSLAGAKLAALSEKYYDEMVALARKTTYFELSTDSRFMDEFVSACFFPHTNVELFPSVMAVMPKSEV